MLEFMLNGDLRRYLRNRRHLLHLENPLASVGQKSEFSVPPTPRLLTSFATDIACALVYLESKKKLHRDIASRNVLIDATGVAKLADFGFSRNVEDTGYYRLCRRGLMPVRWMPPEAIRDGRFSTASDIWAFGVLLYEIITFGELPYRNIMDELLSRSIINGVEIELPQGVRPALADMMKDCWKRNPEERCTAPQLLEFFTRNPKIVTSCVERSIDVDYGDLNDDSDYIPSTTTDTSAGPSIEMRSNATTGSYDPFEPLIRRQRAMGPPRPRSMQSTTSSTAPLLRYVKVCNSNGLYREALEDMHSQPREVNRNGYI